MKRARRLILLALGSAALSWAGAQLGFTQLRYFGRTLPSVTLGGVEYARDSVLGPQLSVVRSGDVLRVEGFGHALLLPIDPDQARASSGMGTVQLDTQRVSAHTATLINDHLYVPLDTLARGLGAQYTPGSFSLPAPQLSAVSSRAGQDIDRLVLDLNRDVRVQSSVTNGALRLVLPGTGGDERTYTTRGRYLPSVRVTRQGDDLVLSAPLPVGYGYRVYRATHPGGVRLVLDVGPGIASSLPALSARVRAPLVVLDPVISPGDSRLGSAALEVARETGALLTKAGWQVRLTRSGGGDAETLAERADLARQSDVFVSLDMASFPGVQARGLTIYEGGGASGVAIIDNLRGREVRDPLALLAVSGSGDNRRLSQLLQGELKAQGLTARRADSERVYLLREAPHAALLLELGSAQGDDTRRQALATALARSVATFLAARASGGKT